MEVDNSQDMFDQTFESTHEIIEEIESKVDIIETEEVGLNDQEQYDEI